MAQNGHAHVNGVTIVNGHGHGQDSTAKPASEAKKTAIEGFVNVSDQDSGAYLRNYKTHQTGISHEEMVRAYSEWANHYDEDLCPGRYNGPEIAANAMAQHYTAEKDRETIRILDVAAGTGRVGHELHKRGFKRIDALEPSNGMLQVLTGRGIYEKTYESSIGYAQVAEIAENAYDALVIAGGMGEGHIPVSAFDEMIRIVRPGGTVFVVMREEYLTYVREYVDKLEPAMDRLQEAGRWQRLSRTIVPEYSFNKNGIVYCFQVLAGK